MKSWIPWLALAALLAGALAIGARGTGGPPSEARRVERLTSEIRCPTCRGLSAAESDAKTAVAIRADVAAQVHDGRSDGEILGSMRDRYGQDILLRPPATGFDALVWATPVALFVIAGAALVLAFRRWRTLGDPERDPEPAPE